MTDEPPEPGWWRASDGMWHPPPKSPAEQSGTPGEPQAETTDVDSMAAQRRIASHTDVAGAVLIAAGIVGGVAWAWDVVCTQFADDDPGSLGARLDLLADTTLVLLLAAALVAGLGLQLRTLAAERTGAPARSVLERPVGPMLLVLGGLLVVLIGGAVLLGGDDDEPAYSNALYLDPPVVDDLPLVYDLPPIELPGLATSGELSDSLYTLEVHSDGCGVFRSGAIGDDLTWSIKDQDGFEVLGRNAAGETQYRYFQPGTYTVVLETWGGSYYVQVSNEVTITC